MSMGAVLNLLTVLKIIKAKGLLGIRQNDGSDVLIGV